MNPLELMEQDLLNLENPVGLGCALDSFAERKTIEELIESLHRGDSDASQLESQLEKFQFILDQYQEQPHLLDPHLEWMLSSLISVARSCDTKTTQAHQSFKYLYHITKVRHYKVVVRHLPHEVADLEPVLAMLVSQDPYDKSTWEIQYVLLLWLSIIIIIPFQLSRLDSIPIGDGYQKKPIATRVMEEAIKYLTIGSEKPQSAAAYLISKFVTRPDAVESHLPKFLDYCFEALVKCEKDINLQKGILLTLALIFKHGKREDFLPYIRNVLKQIIQFKLSNSTEIIVRKSNIKLIQRLGLNFLKPRIASWRYQRGNRLLLTNLAPQNQDIKQSVENIVDDDDEDYDLPEELEEIIEQLLTGLQDKDECVRWSAAKGIGRITGRLPKDLADDVIGSVLELFSSREGNNSWHGGCLAVAELGRRGLLLPENLKDVIPVILKALVYDEQRGSISVGSRIRDSACYVCWSFARAFDPKDLSEYVKELAGALLVVTVFDREVKCRRAASAAFQENVGRQGTFPHGIEILTTVDYFAVSSITRSYLELSVFIAQFEEYVVPLIAHLLEKKIIHWDKNIRDLTAQALHKLTPFALNYMIKEALPLLLQQANGCNLNARHGAILAVGEIVHAVSIIEITQTNSKTPLIDNKLLQNMKSIIPNLKSKKYFHGLGAELMRQAGNYFIKKMSLAMVPFSRDNLNELEGLLIENLSYEHETIQKTATEALREFCTQYYQSSVEHQLVLLNILLEILDSSNKFTKLGAALALGSLPKFLLIQELNNIIKSLVDCAQICEGERKKWVEVRRAAIQSLVSICQTVGIDHSGSSSIRGESLDVIFECLLKAFEDYTADPTRGDIGSVVREAALISFHTLVEIVVRSNQNLITPELTKAFMCKLAQQSQEKLEYIRGQAASIFFTLIHGNLPHIPHQKELLEIFSKDRCSDINWRRAQETYTLFTELLDLPTYAFHVLLGLTVSVGGNIEHVMKHSSAALNSYLKCCNESQVQMLASLLLRIYREFSRVPRLSLALLTMTEQLLLSKKFSLLIENAELSFAKDIFEAVKTEVGRTREFNRIMAAISNYCALIQSHSAVRTKALSQICNYLCLEYPRVRQETASKLYETLILYEVLDDDVCCEVMEILSETNWSDNIDSLRPTRNRLCELMEIPVPKLVKKS